MKRLLLFICIGAMLASHTYGQNRKTKLSLGIGYPSFLVENAGTLSAYTPYDTEPTNQGPVLHVTVQRQLNEYWYAGVYYGQSKNTTKEDVVDRKGRSYTHTLIDIFRLYSVDIGYYFIKNNELDCYASLGVGTKRVKEVINDVKQRGITSNHFFYKSHVGLQYHFTPAIAMYGEVGIGTALLNVGLSYTL